MVECPGAPRKSRKESSFNYAIIDIIIVIAREEEGEGEEEEEKEGDDITDNFNELRDHRYQGM